MGDYTAGNAALSISTEDRALFLQHLGVFLAAMYPQCPEAWRKGLVERAAQRGHFGRLGEIAGILTDTSARHLATDYDKLLRINGRGQGLTREEARMVVADEVREIVERWRKGSAEGDSGYRQLLKTLRRKRMKKGSRKNNPGVAAQENALIADHLRGWLAGRSDGMGGAASDSCGAVESRGEVAQGNGAEGRWRLCADSPGGLLRCRQTSA